MKESKGFKAIADQVYRLTSSAAPLSYMLPTRNTRRFPLLYFDEEKRQNRALRYARNQRSCFEDEQDGNAIIEPIIFDNGFLTVRKDNPVLQEFLYYHPLNGKTFAPVNDEKNAQVEVDKMDLEWEALNEAKNMTIDQLESVARVILGKDTSRMTTAEIKRDIRVSAKRDPKAFLQTINNPTLTLQSKVQLFIDKKFIGYRNSNREVWLNKPSQRKILVIPFGEDATSVLTSYMQSDEGVEILKLLENMLEAQE